MSRYLEKKIYLCYLKIRPIMLIIFALGFYKLKTYPIQEKIISPLKKKFSRK